MIDQIKYELRLVYPDEARALINTQPDGWNRNVRQTHVSAIARDMERGEWNGANGATITVDNTGTLVDGQHRLLAIVKVGKPMLACVVTGVDPSSRMSIDENIPRTGADDIIMEGGKSAHATIAAIRWLVRYERRSQNGQLLAHSSKLSRRELREARYSNPGIIDSLDIVGWSSETSRLWPQPMAAFVHYMASRTSPELADEFVLQVKSGVGLQEGDPAHTLRKVLIKQVEAKGNQGKIGRDRLCALTVKAWLAFEDGRKATLLKWLDGNPAKNVLPEAFPAFKCDKQREAA